MFLRRKFLWVRISRIIESNVGLIKVGNIDLLKISKWWRLGMIDEKDLYVFDEDDVMILYL